MPAYYSGDERAYSHGGALTQAVGECTPQRVVAVEHAPGRLEHRVEQAVSGRAVPQRVEPRAEPLGDLQAPVDHRLLLLQLCNNHKGLDNVRRRYGSMVNGTEELSSGVSMRIDEKKEEKEENVKVRWHRP